MPKKQIIYLSNVFTNGIRRNHITTWIWCLLFVFFIPLKISSKEINIIEKQSVKFSVGTDYLTVGYKYNVNLPFFLQIDVNPMLFATSGIAGYQVYNEIQHEVYLGLGAGLSLYGIVYIYPGIGYRFKLNKTHSIFLEGAIGFYNILYFGDVGIEKDILQIFRIGYQFSIW